MILYHLDRLNTFPSQTSQQLLHPINTYNTIEANKYFNHLYIHGISKHGQLYLNPFDEKTTNYDEYIATYENLKVYTIEYIFEMVRLMHFPSLPSRFTSLFACQSIENLIEWYNKLKKNSMSISNATIKKIETHGQTLVCDAQWRDMPLTLKYDNDIRKHVFNPFAYHEWAKRYWKGDYSATPLIEVLCELPVTVIECTPVHTFFNNLVN